MDLELCEELSWSDRAPRQARRLLAAFLAEIGWHRVVPEAVLLASELVTNALCHASGPLELRASCANGVLCVEVRDSSSVLPTLHEPNGGGRGLHIVAEVASRWGSRRDDRGKVTWFELHRAPSDSVE
jgi:anti-sigma regulatory factor (Ser/Thr protein kinase)